MQKKKKKASHYSKFFCLLLKLPIKKKLSIHITNGQKQIPEKLSNIVSEQYLSYVSVVVVVFLNRVVRLYWVNVWTGAGLDGLGGVVVDQTLSVLISDRNSVDRHTLVL